MTRIVLAYSGGLETSIAIPWLAERHGAEIIAVTIDLGQGKEVLEEIRDRALATGALRAHVVDARDAFARDYIVRALKAGILGDAVAGRGGAGAPADRAEGWSRSRNIEQATIVAHGDPAGSGVAARPDDPRARSDDDRARARRRLGHDAGAAARLRARAPRDAAGRVQRPRRPRVGAAVPPPGIRRAGVGRHRVRARRAGRHQRRRPCRCSICSAASASSPARTASTSLAALARRARRARDRRRSPSRASSRRRASPSDISACCATAGGSRPSARARCRRRRRAAAGHRRRAADAVRRRLRASATSQVAPSRQNDRARESHR